MSRAILITLAGLLVLAGCRKRSQASSSVPSGVAEADQTTAAANLEAAPLADPAAAATPLPPPNAEITVAVERRFLPAEPMNAYSPAQRGDYQAQLNLYNRVLLKRVADLGYTPETMQELMASSGLPKPPQPPAGRKLVYDRKTIAVSLQ